MSVTQEKVRRLFSYDAETGLIVRLGPTIGGRRPGDPAGRGCGRGRQGYPVIVIEGTSYATHRVIWLYMTGAWPEAEIDHINGDVRDNKWRNLREATARQNSLNQRRRKDSQTGIKGVTQDKRTGRWRAYVSPEVGKRKWLGFFATKEEAAAVRRAAALDLYGKFARED